MARINIEEEIWVDGRYKVLVRLLKGDEALAIGHLVLFWRLAQESYKKNELVPEFQFKLYGFPEALLEAGFIEKRNGGYKAVGDTKHFEWLRQKSEAGKKGAAVTNSRVRTKKPVQNLTHESNQILSNGTHPKHTAKIRRPKPKVTNEQNQQVSFGTSQHPTPSSSFSYSNKKETTLSSGDDLHPLATLWNKECGALPKVKEMNKDRVRLCAQAWKKNQDLGYWSKIIKALTTDKFCSGENDRGWRANFDYFLRPAVQTRAIEGSIGAKSSVRRVFDSAKGKIMEVES